MNDNLYLGNMMWFLCRWKESLKNDNYVYCGWSVVCRMKGAGMKHGLLMNGVKVRVQQVCSFYFEVNSESIHSSSSPLLWL